ncbi:hypothetical protein U5922_004770 [Aquicoccus sp. G2-2]|uniref:hypothetical protein n=1 Tax=Aquicoccus sp. G2-2 TaxID=3092120 RepID=UPI002AE03D06|nr:hypothetical protein [Aquicoccus sp. G2-2]MEA1112819.1 hypothetical protein [Aquicoccus sp. G2-2]
MERNDNIGVMIAVLFFGVLYWFPGFSREEIQSYSARCANDAVVAPLAFAEEIGMTTEQLRKSIRSCEIIAGGKTRYSVNMALNQVTYRVGDLPVLHKQTDCMILDKKDWQCRYPDGSGGIGFAAGLEALPKSEIKYGFFYQRGWQYYITRLMNIFGPVNATWLIPDQVVPY